LTTKFWGINDQRVYRTKVQDVNDLRQRLIDVWGGVELSSIDDAIDVSMFAFEPPQEDILNIHYDLH